MDGLWIENSVISNPNISLKHERGQHIGLHFALNGMTDMQQIRKRIQMEIDILSEMFGFEITEFSIHRPL